MAPCVKTSGNVSNTFPDTELNQGLRKNEFNSSEDWMAEVYSGDYSIPLISSDIEFYLPPSDSQHMSMDLSMDNQFNENKHANVHTDLKSVEDIKFNLDFHQEIPIETNEEKPSYLLDHCYSQDSENPVNNNVSSESNTFSTRCETGSNGNPCEEIDDGNVEESTVLPVNIETQNYRRRGQQRVKNNIRQIVEKEQNETHSRRKKKKGKGKAEKDEETRSRHNRMERERRLEIKLAFKNLASVMNVLSKHSNVHLLNKAVTVVKDLEEKDRKSSLMFKELKERNEILKRKLSKLQKHFK